MGHPRESDLIDWNDVARSVGRDLAPVFLRHVEAPFTPEKVQAGLQPAAAAALVVFDQVGAPADDLDRLATLAVDTMLRTIGVILEGRGAVKH